MELGKPWWTQLRSPPVDRLRGGSFRRRRAGVSPFGEKEQARPGVALVRSAHDVSAIDEVFDELACGLLCDPEVRGHVGGRGTTLTDPRKRETMCRANVIKAAASETLLYPIYQLAGKAEHCNGRLPTVACHGDHLDMK